MKPEFQSILDALYKLDPQLKEKEEALVKILGQLQKATPDFKVNPQFAENLKEKLFNVSVEVSPKPKMEVLLDDEGRVSLWLRRIFYPLGGAVITVGLVFAILLSEDQLIELTPQSIDGVEVITLSDQAFGPLAHSGTSEKVEVDSVPAISTQEEGLIELVDAQVSESMIETSLPILEPRAITTYHYNYEGEPLELPENVEVYKRLSTPMATPVFNNFLDSLGFGLMNLNSLESLNIENIRLKQDKNDYVVELDFNRSQISLFSDNDEWLSQEVELAELPDERTVVNISNVFLNLYGIETKSYGAPTVEHYERNNPELFSPHATVIYPIVLDEKIAYQAHGIPVGLTVEVDVPRRKIISIQGLRTEQFERASYQAVSDWSDIEAYLEKAGNDLFHYHFEEGAQDQAIDLKLGKPIQVLMQVYNDEYLGDPLLTPALRFPVLSEDDYAPDYLFVPLAKELLESDMTQRFHPPILPIPLSEPPSIQPAVLNVVPRTEPKNSIPILTQDDENVAATTSIADVVDADDSDPQIMSDEGGVQASPPDGM